MSHWSVRVFRPLKKLVETSLLCMLECFGRGHGIPSYTQEKWFIMPLFNHHKKLSLFIQSWTDGWEGTKRKEKEMKGNESI